LSDAGQALARVVSAGVQSGCVNLGHDDADGLADEVVSTVLEAETLVAVTEAVFEDVVEGGLGIDIADDMAELDGAASSQTLRNMVPKPVPTESITL
jgi:hypothetical protein